jgi:molybdenum cofactor synthesis domain-containing protein
MQRAVAIVVIGNEILSAKVEDSNAPWLVKELRAVGMPVLRIVTIPDEIPVIAQTVRTCAHEFEQVITTGGVGPTLDDVTIEAVALALGRKLVVEPRLETAIRQHYGAATLPAHLKMALVPEGATLTDPPGAIWPVVDVANVLVLPGDPSIMRRKFTSIRERFRRTPPCLRRVYLCGDEGFVAPHLDLVHAAHPTVQLGSYPRYDGRAVEVMVTLEAADAAAVEAAVALFLRSIDPAMLVRVD